MAIPGLPPQLTNNGRLLSYLRSYYNQNGSLPMQYQQYNPYLTAILGYLTRNTYGVAPAPYPYQYGQPTYPYAQAPYQQPYPYQYGPGGYPTYGDPQCTSQGFIYNPATGGCSAPPSNPYIYDPTGAYSYANNAGYTSPTPPNVLGQPLQVAAQALNQAGWLAWEVYRDGINTGAPTDGYNPHRVLVNTQGGLVISEAIG